jgi:hypothetical protein
MNALIPKKNADYSSDGLERRTLWMRKPLDFAATLVCLKKFRQSSFSQEKQTAIGKFPKA